MITAELEHNPYILKTAIRFNKKEPRVNSLVEKYQTAKLQTWIKKIPSIFHDEMNGYDFSLEFSGTRTDYEELKKAFADAGVTQNQVNILLKRQLEDRLSKLEDLNSLLVWLNDNPNHYFDLETFRSENEDLFDGAYPFIIVNGRSLDTSIYDQSDIDVQSIEQVSELIDADLVSTPIVFYISRETLNSLQQNIKYILGRNDVIHEQIFFYIHPKLDIQKVTRLIRDLGIAKPQIIKGVNDPAIKRFMEIYPYTDYIHESILQLKTIAAQISGELAEKNKEAEKTGSKTHAEIHDYDERLSKLKAAREEFESIHTLEMPEAWKISEDMLIDAISDWRKKKVKMTKDEEAFREAGEFNKEFQKRYSKFCDDIRFELMSRNSDLDCELKEIFDKAEFDVKDFPKMNDLHVHVNYMAPSIRDSLFMIKEEVLVEQKDDFMGMLFKQSSEHTMVKEVTYLYQNWREYVIRLAKDKADELINKCYEALSELYFKTIGEYMVIIQNEIDRISAERNEAASKLSDEEKSLQTDNDWLSEFKERLNNLSEANYE